MSGTLDTRVCSTQDLIYLCEVADAYGFNRRLDTDHIRKQADPNGKHLLVLRLFDHQRRTPDLGTAQRAEVRRLTGRVWKGDPVHNRVNVLVKLKDTMTPLDGMLDVPAVIWNQIALVEDYMNAAAAASDTARQAME